MAIFESAVPKLKSPRRIAFSHAFSELLVVKSVRAYADGRALELGGLELIHGTTQNGDLAHQLAEVSAWIEISGDFLRSTGGRHRGPIPQGHGRSAGIDQRSV